MSDAIAAAIQLAGGVALAPLLPGLVQTGKARLQGRRGASPVQPYRELRRLWRRSVVRPEGSGPVYALAPAVVAACLLLCVLLVPVAGTAAPWPLGNDAILVVGLLGLARLTVAAAAWDTGSGFALMGAARDLAIAVAVEALLLGTLVVAALSSRSTDLVTLSIDAAGWEPWTQAAHWCGAGAFALVVIAETGRQPVDNPDTHLELTMIHEGPLLEYGGRDQALLQWAMAARHWVVAVLAAEIFLPHARGGPWHLASVAAGVAAVCLGLAATETSLAKVRLLQVPRLIGSGVAVCALGLIIGVAGT